MFTWKDMFLVRQGCQWAGNGREAAGGTPLGRYSHLFTAAGGGEEAARESFCAQDAFALCFAALGSAMAVSSGKKGFLIQN